jgi:hypothetical protein
MKLQRPEPIPVEEFFNEFVLEFGGELVSNLMTPNTNLPRNADYLFRQDKVVCELKCLEKDLFNNDEDVERLMSLIENWISSGKITGHKALRWVLGQERLNEECYADLIKLARRTTETAIRSAKHQIQSTKNYFKLPKANGLLLIANDGNYFLEHQNFFRLILKVMINKFMDSSIDGFVYFSANMPVTMPYEKREMLVWFPGYRKENDIALVNFVNKLGEKWDNFYLEKIGEEVTPPTQFDNLDEAVDTLNAMKLIREYRVKK